MTLRSFFFGTLIVATAIIISGCASFGIGAINASNSLASNSGDKPGCYEMRIYYAAPGKLDDLHARFRDHTLRLFKKHGIRNVGYWVPIDNKENKLIFLLAYPNRA